MRDNKTSQAASEYDANVHKTLPRYHLFHTESLDLVKAAMPKPEAWLDTGCGTGTFILQAIECFGEMEIVAADPAEEMLSMAKKKLADYQVTYMQAGSEELVCTDNFDVVTAIMSHHYLPEELRKQATKNCYKLLKQGGIYITFETIRPTSRLGTQIGLERWKNAQLLSGKDATAVEKHISRYGIEIFPITIQEHIDILQEAGFSTVEVLWVSCMQAGFYAIK